MRALRPTRSAVATGILPADTGIGTPSAVPLPAEPAAADRASLASPWRGRGPRTTLARRFLLTSLAVLTAAGVITAVWVGGQLERGIVDRTAAVTALYVESFIEPSLGSLDAGGPLAPDQVRALDDLLVATPMGESIVALRVWAPDGTVRYSSNASMIGQTFPVEGGLAAALQGTVHAELSGLTQEEHAGERTAFDRLLEMYIPLRAQGADRIVGAAEFYKTTDDIDAEVFRAQLTTWIVLAVALVLTAGLLFGIVKQGSDTIASQEQALTRQVGELSELLRQNEALGERVRTAADRATTINERSLRRISSDLHDGPGQTLSLALMRLDSLRERSAAGEPPAATELAEVEQALQDAMRDMRAIAAGLRMPELAPLSVADVAGRAVGDHQRRTGVPVELQLGSLPADVPLSVKITFYRALQELLSNATRHGGGAGIRVTVDSVEGILRLEVADQGPGFDPERLAGSSGLGLPGMREQAELLGGGFQVLSAPGRGTAVRAWWPLATPRTGNGTTTR
jgi:signal transduction histidine kinase